MSKYEVQVDWAGFSKGRSIYVVEADSPEEVEEVFGLGVITDYCIDEDDTVERVTNIILIEEN